VTKKKISFTRDDLKKAVLKEATEHPVTLGTTALGIISGAGIALFGAETVFILSSLGFLSLGLSSFGYNYFVKKEHYQAKYLEKLQKDLERQNKEKLENLKSNLSSDFENGQKYATQGINQVKEVQEKIDSFLDVLSGKFDSNSITYKRYSGSVEQVYGSLLDNLKKVVDILRASDTINLSDLKTRLKELIKSDDPADIYEKETLEDRLKTLEQNLDKVNNLMSQNEKALTTIVKVTSELSFIDTSTKDSTGTIEDGIDDLETLSKNTKIYNS